MAQIQPMLTFRALALLLVFLGTILVVFTLVSMWIEDRLDWSLSGIIWFSLATGAFCIVIALLTASV
jgi:hypothetical protein